jgi:toxin FitB
MGAVMFLLDTPVVLALRQVQARGDTALLAWARGVPRHSLFLSALGLIELENAAARLTARDKAGAAALRGWIEAQVIPAFEGRILPIDAAVVSRRAQLGYADPRDGLLAATALVHGLTLATRDTAAFRAGKVKLLNPWRYTPEMAAEEEDWTQASRGGPAWLKNLFVR